jgi:hypothetical protein
MSLPTAEIWDPSSSLIFDPSFAENHTLHDTKDIENYELIKVFYPTNESQAVITDNERRWQVRIECTSNLC